MMVHADNWLMFMVYDGIFTYINGWFNSSARSWSQTVLRFWLAPIQPDLLGQMNPWNRSPIRTSDRQSSREWFFTISIIFLKSALFFVEFGMLIHFFWKGFEAKCLMYFRLLPRLQQRFLSCFKIGHLRVAMQYFLTSHSPHTLRHLAMTSGRQRPGP